MKPVVVSLLLIIGFSRLVAQDHTPDLQQLSDEILATQELDLNYEEVYENLYHLLSQPIDINNATEDELRFINILTDYQIDQFINYRKEQGSLLSVYELQSIPGFDSLTIRKVLPFIKITDPSAVIDKSLLQRIVEEENNYLLMRYERIVEEKRGFKGTLSPEQQFKGSPDKLYMRFRTSRPGDFSIGFTTEKDAGEVILWKPDKHQFGLDYYSFHLQLQNKGHLKNFIAGDYQLQAGQGLVLGSAFGLGKGGETILTTRKTNLGLLPYTSANESGFMRGLGISYQLHPQWTLTGFYSRIKNDATFSSDSTDASVVSAFRTTGLHRNETELGAKNNIIEESLGTIINYRIKRLDAGIIWHASKYSQAVSREPLAYNQFAFAGNASHNGSLFANYTFKNFSFFAETAVNKTGAMATVAGLLGSLTSRLDISLVYRNYARHYYAPYSNAFGENAINQNEQGFYWGWKYKWNKATTLSGYVDLFYFPWLRFRSYVPSEGHEWMLRFNYEPSRSLSCHIQAREESKVRNDGASELITYKTYDGIKRNFLLHVQYRATPNLSFRTRLQGSTFTFNKDVTKGSALLQDIRWDAGRLAITARYALFDTDNYDNRQYTFENDVWLAFSIIPYYGKGVRNYLLAEYKFNKRVAVWFRYARTRYIDKNEIGSGLDSITSNMRNDIKLQLMLRL